MSQNLSSPSPMQPLSVGNVVTAGLRLYRSHLKSYFQLALKACLWSLIPVYGWAKFYAIAGLISRLAFGELVNQPESIEAGSRYVNSKLWQFLIAVLLMAVILLGVGTGFFILVAVFIALFAGLATVGNTSAILIATAIAILAAIAFIIGAFWLLTRFFGVEVPLAIEDNVDGTSTISRSWDLTKGYVWRILAISFVTYLITLPLQIAVQVVSTIIQLVLIPLLQQGSAAFNVLFFLLILGLSLLSGAVVVPFWQAIKAVVYYDLRTRREGLGLKLRNRNI